MKSFAAILLFPYLLPSLAISALILGWGIVAPNRSTYFGINEDVIGLFVVAWVWAGCVAQVVIGIPFCFLLSWIAAPLWRRLMATVAVALAFVPFGGHLANFAATLIVIVGSISVGVCISLRTFHPNRNRRAELDGASDVDQPAN